MIDLKVFATSRPLVAGGDIRCRGWLLVNDGRWIPGALQSNTRAERTVVGGFIVYPWSVLRRFLSWDTPSKAAALLCLVAGIVPFAVGAAAPTGATADSEWWQWLILPLAIALFTPFVGAPQIGMLILIRLTRIPVLRAMYLLSSFLMIGITYWFVTTADLTSNSTAPLAMMFFPLQVAGIAFAVGGAALWIANLVVERRNRSGN
jgi:hypothetical protein